MASEAQRIMNLSLTKIVSSRSRRGGVSLHRNLLVASVLFKARDVYAAEMAGLVVIRNGSVYDRTTTVDDSIDTQTEETQVQPSNDDHTSNDDNLIPEERIQQTVNAVVVTQSSSVNTDHQLCDSVDEVVDRESAKENIEPNIKTVPLKAKRSRKQQSGKETRKRKCTEVELAVLNITGEIDCGVAEKKARLDEEKTSLDCCELSSCLPESIGDRDCVTETQLTVLHSSDYHHTRQGSSQEGYNTRNDEDQTAYSTYQPSYHSFSGDCYTSANDALAYSMSHPMLVVSV